MQYWLNVGRQAVSVVVPSVPVKLNVCLRTTTRGSSFLTYGVISSGLAAIPGTMQAEDPVDEATASATRAASRSIGLVVRT